MMARRGRKPGREYTERFILMMRPDMAARIEEHRIEHDLVHNSVAIRDLIERGLEAAEQ